MSSCSGDNVQAVATEYNENSDVITYTGIMFQILAATDIEILTIEFDARYDDKQTTDLSLEVYTKRNDYIDSVNVPGDWELVAETVGIPVSTKSNLGVIIPHRQFQPIAIPKGGTQSLYITMLSGSYIDFNVDALQKTGEVMLETSDLSMTVGSGFSEPRFPYAGVNRTVSPMFSGIIHYRTKDCIDNNNGINDEFTSVSTVIKFPFLLNTPAVSTELQNDILNAIVASIDSIIDESGSKLQLFRDQYDLKSDKTKMKVELVDYNGACSKDWSYCPSQYVSSSITVTSKNTIESGVVKYEVYKKLSNVIMAAARAIASNPTGTEVTVAYIGEKAVEADYTVELIGVESDRMSEDQEKYFTEVLTIFLGESMATYDAAILATTVSSDNDMNTSRKHRRLRTNASSESITISGTISGSCAASKTIEMFQLALDDTFSLDAMNFEKKLEYAALKPGTANDSNIYDYFFNSRLKYGIITSASETSPFATGNNTNAATTTPQQTTPTGLEWPVSTILMFVGAGIVVVVGLFFLLQFFLKAIADRKRQMQREIRRALENKGNTNVALKKEPCTPCLMQYPIDSPTNCTRDKKTDRILRSARRNENEPASTPRPSDRRKLDRSFDSTVYEKRQRSKSSDQPNRSRSRSNSNIDDIAEKTEAGRQEGNLSLKRSNFRRSQSNDRIFDSTIPRAKGRPKDNSFQGMLSPSTQSRQSCARRSIDCSIDQTEISPTSDYSINSISPMPRRRSKSHDTSSPRTTPGKDSSDKADKPKLTRARSSDDITKSNVFDSKSYESNFKSKPEKNRKKLKEKASLIDMMNQKPKKAMTSRAA